MSREERLRELEEINSRLQRILDNSFLSKLDLMFSVLISLTIFGISLMLNNISSVVGLPRAFLVSFLILMIYTLIGEFWSILKDDAVNRFAFWISLLAAIGIMGVSLPFLAIILFPPFWPLYLIFPFAFLLFLSWLAWRIDSAFIRYAKQLPSRKLPRTAVGSVWRTIRNGSVIFIVSIIANLLIFIL